MRTEQPRMEFEMVKLHIQESVRSMRVHTGQVVSFDTPGVVKAWLRSTQEPQEPEFWRACPLRLERLERLAEVIRERPEGPLAVSHRRGMGPRRTDCRYDHVLHTAGLEVADIKYLCPEAVAAGSDHPLVAADLVLGT